MPSSFHTPLSADSITHGDRDYAEGSFNGQMEAADGGTRNPDRMPVLYVSEVARRWAVGLMNLGNPAQAPLVAINLGVGSPMKFAGFYLSYDGASEDDGASNLVSAARVESIKCEGKKYG